MDFCLSLHADCYHFIVQNLGIPNWKVASISIYRAFASSSRIVAVFALTATNSWTTSRTRRSHNVAGLYVCWVVGEARESWPQGVWVGLIIGGDEEG